jgi:hypothetical protein
MGPRIGGGIIQDVRLMGWGGGVVGIGLAQGAVGTVGSGLHDLPDIQEGMVAGGVVAGVSSGVTIGIGMGGGIEATDRQAKAALEGGAEVCGKEGGRKGRGEGAEPVSCSGGGAVDEGGAVGVIGGFGGEELVPGVVVGDADKLALEATKEAGREAGEVMEGCDGEGGGGREAGRMEAEGAPLDGVDVKWGGVPV